MTLKSLLLFLSFTMSYSSNIKKECNLCQMIILPNIVPLYGCGTYDVKELDETLNNLFYLKEFKIEFICIEEIFFQQDRIIRCFDKCNKNSHDILKIDKYLNNTDNILILNNTSIHHYLNKLFDLTFDKLIYFINKICLKIGLELKCFT